MDSIPAQVDSATQPPQSPRRIWREVLPAALAGLALVGAAGFCFMMAVGISLCSLFGEQCSDSEQLQIKLLIFLAISFAVSAVPVPVLIWRRQRRRNAASQ